MLQRLRQGIRMKEWGGGERGLAQRARQALPRSTKELGSVWKEKGLDGQVHSVLWQGPPGES